MFKANTHTIYVTIVATQQAYVPPSMRGQQNKASTKLHEYELPSNMKQSQAGESTTRVRTSL